MLRHRRSRDCGAAARCRRGRRPRLLRTDARARAPARGERLRRRAVPLVCREYRGVARGERPLTETATETLAAIREAPGLEEYLDAIEERLARTVASHPGLVASVGNEALAAGGEPPRPGLRFPSPPPGPEPSLPPGRAGPPP